MSGRIEVSGIRARGRHGVFPQEKRDGQDFVVDIVLEADLTAAGSSDDLADTVNYAELAALVVTRIEGPSLDLIERLATLIATDLLAADASRFLVDAVTVTVHKPQAPVGVPFEDVAAQVRVTRDPVPVVIALGTNLGDRAAVLETAVAAVAERICTGMPTVSGQVETDPVGGPDQPDYRNAVAVGRTRLAPSTVLRILHDIEAEAGRTRAVRWGPRTLDLDLIQYGDPVLGTDLTSATDRLTLPHPRAHERGFVLVPWLDADPEASLRVGAEVHPVRALVEHVDTSGVRPVTGAGPDGAPHRPGGAGC